jgi:hypothetical protein
MRARHALLFAALVMLPDYSFAQRVTVSALTHTFEVASGLVSTQDTARVEGFIQMSGPVVVGTGGTTSCDQSAPFPKQNSRPIAPGELSNLGGFFETPRLQFTPTGYPPLPANASLGCTHTHTATAVQLSLFDTSFSFSGGGFEIKINSGEPNPATQQLSKTFTLTKPPFSAIASVDSCLQTNLSSANLSSGLAFSSQDCGLIVAYFLLDEVSRTCPAKLTLVSRGGDASAIGSLTCDAAQNLLTLFLNGGLFGSIPTGGVFSFASPIIFDLGQPGLDLTGLDAPVQFDLNADGTKELTGWTAAGSEDAFLVFDRNMNGNVDDGMELFGDAVQLPDGSISMQGYDALAQLDVPSQGGNGNGVADIADRGYAKLRLWTDTNHNGVSERDELEPLIRKGVFAISLEFTSSTQMDESGNVLAFSAPAFVRERGSVRRIPTTDVFFRTAAVAN